MPELKAPPQTINKIMVDVRQILGLSQEEVAYLLYLLEKADFGHLAFVRGSTYIRFGKLNIDEKDFKITLTVSMEYGAVRNEYTVPRTFIRLANRKSLGSLASNLAK